MRSIEELMLSWKDQLLNEKKRLCYMTATGLVQGSIDLYDDDYNQLKMLLECPKVYRCVRTVQHIRHVLDDLLITPCLFILCCGVIDSVATSTTPPG